VSAPGIEDTTNYLQKLENEKQELSCKLNEASKSQQRNCQADHVDVNRPLEQLPFTVWGLLIIPMYVPLSTSRQTGQTREWKSGVRQSG
jgi:hypothetical protein